MKTSYRFLQTCPLELDHFPEIECQLAINRIKKEKDASSCEWYICDEASNYCFWYWLSKKGNQRSHTLQEIAELTNTSINNNKLAADFAIERIKRHLKQLGSLDGEKSNGYETIIEYVKDNCL